ncbi:SapC family protein [Gilvimarinus sp. SDUM040013]|uniref:SapC family protein n=1 Tax=Gilvimarinus gilvus TaxID=3058038 RepID=A0ABU4S4T4_9GAMM|nr:SapC family protein [Gilvimarinus sp. SDUM040013]MDO3387140.1 SapC family protein [Gilvimarinus sp. SDUM040013]MDX6850883.1 SapC family protein [Gilvimarinus sp. SDUM040013]
MANNVLLNNVSHQDLKVLARFGAEFGDNVGSVLAFPTEFVELQKEYPILFKLNKKTEKYQSIALLGLNQGENLFLDSGSESGWAANYIPAAVAKGPFLIGIQSQSSGESNEAMIHIDLDHAKVGHQDGHALFLEHGGNSPYLEHVANLLKVIHQGVASQDLMFRIFLEMDLIEPVNIEFDLHSGEKYQLSGHYTINEEKLAQLEGEKLEKLSKLGFLPLAYAVTASMTNIRKLIDIKNRQLS